MIQLLMISDDFTGALDTGVQFATQGARTRVVTNPEIDLHQIDDSVEVLVIDAETRHLPAQQAYDIVYRIVERSVALGIPYIYKKTDSALRGNVGAELTATLRASGHKQLVFLPAFPQIGRCTVNGMQMINGVPVAQSVFGKDPFEPVTHSRIDELIRCQSTEKVTCYPAVRRDSDLPGETGIVVLDAQTTEDLAIVAERLMVTDRLHVMAGCAGFGALLPRYLGLTHPQEADSSTLSDRLLVLCGSVNPITVAQLAHAQRNGFVRMGMTPDQKLTPGYFATTQGQALIDEWRAVLDAHPACIIDANDEGGNEPTARYAAEHGMTIEDVRVGISSTLGEITGALFDHPSVGTLLVTGGDTLLQVMNCMGVYEMEPLRELYSGVVLSRFTRNGCTRLVISKSGGFGSESLMTDLFRSMARPAGN